MSGTSFGLTTEDYERYVRQHRLPIDKGPLRPEGMSFMEAMMSESLPDHILEYLKEGCV